MEWVKLLTQKLKSQSLSEVTPLTFTEMSEQDMKMEDCGVESDEENAEICSITEGLCGHNQENEPVTSASGPGGALPPGVPSTPSPATHSAPVRRPFRQVQPHSASPATNTPTAPPCLGSRPDSASWCGGESCGGLLSPFSELEGARMPAQGATAAVTALNKTVLMECAHLERCHLGNNTPAPTQSANSDPSCAQPNPSERTDSARDSNDVNTKSDSACTSDKPMESNSSTTPQSVCTPDSRAEDIDRHSSEEELMNLLNSRQTLVASRPTKHCDTSSAVVSLCAYTAACDPLLACSPPEKRKWSQVACEESAHAQMYPATAAAMCSRLPPPLTTINCSSPSSRAAPSPSIALRSPPTGALSPASFMEHAIARAAASVTMTSQLRHGGRVSDSPASSDEEVRDVLCPHYKPSNFSASPPRHVTRATQKTVSPRLFLANVNSGNHGNAAAAATTCWISPRKRQRQASVGEASAPGNNNNQATTVIQRPCLDFEKMQKLSSPSGPRRQHPGTHGGGMTTRARVVKIKTLNGTGRPTKYILDPAAYSFRSISTNYTQLTPVEEPCAY